MLSFVSRILKAAHGSGGKSMYHLKALCIGFVMIGLGVWLGDPVPLKAGPTHAIETMIPDKRRGFQGQYTVETLCYKGPDRASHEMPDIRPFPRSIFYECHYSLKIR